ncbi:hypothetical protein ANRL1_02123 [Anaerolineae bacterium]|nr:hypothetical protein ANRL1_02123 [Anaerolineae bacterium]
MKLYFLFAAMDLLILLAYPLVYIANQVQKLTNARTGRKQA